MESIEASGKSVDEAVQQALTRLGKRRDEVEIAVVQEPSRGIVGLGGREAVVRVTPRPSQLQSSKPTGAVITPEMADAILGPDAEVPLPEDEEDDFDDEDEEDDTYLNEEFDDDDDEEFDDDDDDDDEDDEPLPFVSLTSPATPVPSLVADAGMSGIANTPETVPDGEMQEVEVPSREDVEITVDVLQHILHHMNIHATVQVRSTSPLTLNIHGINENLGLLIGRRGETLAALQLLVNLIVSHRTHHRMRIIVDAENYRQRREENLRSLAMRVAQQVRSYRRSIALEAMPPHERRIVHIALSESKDISTESIGEGDERRVVISLKRAGR